VHHSEWKEQASFTKQHREDLSLPGYDVMSITIWEPMFKRSLLPPSSGELPQRWSQQAPPR